MQGKITFRRFWQLARIFFCVGALWVAQGTPALRAAPKDSTILQTCEATELLNAVVSAEADVAADAIVLAPNCNGANAYMLTLANNAGNGLPVITTNLTIEGNNSTIARSTANGVPQFRLFQVNPQAILTLNNLTLQGGNAGSGDGGAVFTTGSLYINASTVNGNTATHGGGISVQYPGTVYLTASTFSGNSATGWGGGITVNTGGIATITQSTFAGNSLASGGLFGAGFAMLNSSATIANSTFYNNNAGGGIGGGIGIEAGNLNLVNDTIVGNTAPGSNGGGISNQGNTLIQNTIVSENSGNNCTTINDMDQGNNIDSGNSCGFTGSTSLSGTNPNLGPLANNGGPTQTMALAANSPAIGAANRVGCNAHPVAGIDQRGMSRQQTLQCDIGAYEFENSTLGCSQAPGVPKLISPNAGAVLKRKIVTFDWKFDDCARKYQFRVVTAGNPNQVLVQGRTKVSHFTSTVFESGKAYAWQVRACANHQCGEWSSLRPFSIKP